MALFQLGLSQRTETAKHPYNFLQYYEFYTSFAKPLQEKIENMPKQAIYTLASRSGTLRAKEKFILGYKGQTKNELLTLIRDRFPLSEKDKRKENIPQIAIQKMHHIVELMDRKAFTPTEDQKEELYKLLDALRLQNTQSKIMNPSPCYESPLITRYASKEMLCDFFKGVKIHHMEEALGFTCSSPERAWIKYLKRSNHRA